MKTNNPQQNSSIGQAIEKIYRYKDFMAKTVGTVLVLAAIFIFSLPRTYKAEIILAPESSSGIAGGIANLAASFGVDLGGNSSSDAIIPEMYPDLLATNDFAASLLPSRIQTTDGKYDCTYQEFIELYGPEPWWTSIGKAVKGLFVSDADSLAVVDFRHLTRTQEEMLQGIAKSIECEVNRITSVVTISFEENDAEVAAIVLDSIRVRLQEFVTEYRIKKCLQDLEYYQRVTAEAKEDYYKARHAYSAVADANVAVRTEAARLRVDDLRTEMDLRQQNYTMMNTQLMAAVAKLQEKMPVFTVLQASAVPTRPSGPKRMIFMALMLILSVSGAAFYVIKRKP